MHNNDDLTQHFLLFWDVLQQLAKEVAERAKDEIFLISGETKFDVNSDKISIYWSLIKPNTKREPSLVNSAQFFALFAENLAKVYKNNRADITSIYEIEGYSLKIQVKREKS